MSLRQQYRTKWEKDTQRILSLGLRFATEPSSVFLAEAKAILASMHDDITKTRILLSEDEDILQKMIDDINKHITETKENIQSLRKQLQEAIDDKDSIRNMVYQSIQECVQLRLREDHMRAKLKALCAEHQTFMDRIQECFLDVKSILY